MGYYHTDEIDGGTRQLMNAGARGKGALRSEDVISIAELCGMSPRTVSQWFQPAGRIGLVKNSYIGDRLCCLEPREERRDEDGNIVLGLEGVALYDENDEQERARIVLGACYGQDGLERMPLYGASDPVKNKRTMYKPCENLGTAAQFVLDYYDGGFDRDVGFRISKAWVKMFIEPWFGAQKWRVVVWYNDWDADDESDPDEPCPCEGDE